MALKIYRFRRHRSRPFVICHSLNAPVVNFWFQRLPNGAFVRKIDATSRGGGKKGAKMTPVAEAQAPSTTSLSAYGQARSTIQGSPLSSEELRKTHAYWRACTYLALGMIYLQDNPLLKESL